MLRSRRHLQVLRADDRHYAQIYAIHQTANVVESNNVFYANADLLFVELGFGTWNHKYATPFERAFGQFIVVAAAIASIDNLEQQDLHIDAPSAAQMFLKLSIALTQTPRLLFGSVDKKITCCAWR